MLGLLVAIGLDPAAAVAAALLHRVVDKGFATVLGFITYAVVRHRLRLTSIVATRPARHIRVEGLKGVPGMWPVGIAWGPLSRNNFARWAGEQPLLRNLGTSLSPASCATDQSLNNSSSRLSYLGPRASVIALTTSGDGTAWSA